MSDNDKRNAAYVDMCHSTPPQEWSVRGIFYAGYDAAIRDSAVVHKTENGIVTVSFDPAKYKLVPIEPTEKMIDAMTDTAVPCVHIDSISAKEKFMARYKYERAIAAAPELGSE